MKLFKIILISILLSSIGFGVCGQPTTLELDTSITDTEVIIPSWRTLEIRPRDLMNYDSDYEYWDYEDEEDDSIVYQVEPDTLLLWFKSLTLDEKVKLYNWWKLESVNLKIVSEYPFGELFIRLDKVGD